MHHVKISKEIEMGKRKAPNEFIQMARQKVLPKLSLVFLKSPINEDDHISSEVGPTASSKIFQEIQKGLEN